MNDAQLAVKNWDRKSSRPAAFAIREVAGFNKYWGIFECEDIVSLPRQLDIAAAKVNLIVWRHRIAIGPTTPGSKFLNRCHTARSFMIRCCERIRDEPRITGWRMLFPSVEDCKASVDLTLVHGLTKDMIADFGEEDFMVHLVSFHVFFE